MSTKWTDEFRADAVALCLRGERTLREVASDLGVNHWTLRDWYRADQVKRAKKTPKPRKPKTKAQSPQMSTESSEDKIRRLEKELRRLERENAQLQMDREILKKAAAFFAKESE